MKKDYNMTSTRSAFLVMLCLPLMINADNFFDNTAGAIITSPANARGVDNVDCSLSQVDSVEVIESKVCVIESQISEDFNGTFTMLDTVESKVCVIDSKIDNIMVDVMVDQTDTLTAIAVVNSKVSAGLCQPTLISDADVPLTITSPGMYIVTENLDLAYSDTVITISANDVTVDLCGFTVSGGKDVTGIVVSASQENVTIKNGVIAGTDYTLDRLGVGIAIEAGASRVIVQDVDIIDTEIIALDLRSTDASRITNVTIERCHIDNPEIGIQVSEAAAGITIDHVTITTGRNYAIYCDASGGSTSITDLIITNCSVTRCDATVLSVFTDEKGGLVYIATCEGVTISELVIGENTLSDPSGVCVVTHSSEVFARDIEIRSNTFPGTLVGGRVGFGLFVCDNIQLKNVNVVNNVVSAASGKQFTSFLIDTVNNSRFNNCVALVNSPGFSNSSLNADFLLDTSSNNIFEGCQATGNAALASIISAGFKIDTSSNNNIFLDCLSEKHTTGGGYGFNNSPEVVSQNNKFIRCIAKNNAGSGFRSRGDIGGTDIIAEFKDCQSFDNSEYGFEFFSSSPTDNVVLRNVACGNSKGNYNNMPSNAVITSAANAKGWDNIDCSDMTGDIVESKLCVIESKVDLLLNYLI